MNPDSFCRTIVNDPNIILLISSAFLWSPNSIVQQTIAHQTHESTRKHRNQPQKKKNKSAQQAMFRKRQQSQKHVDDWRRHFVEQDSLAYRHQPYRRLDFVVHHSAIFDVHQNTPLGFWKLREGYILYSGNDNGFYWTVWSIYMSSERCISPYSTSVAN